MWTKIMRVYFEKLLRITWNIPVCFYSYKHLYGNLKICKIHAYLEKIIPNFEILHKLLTN